MFRRPSTPRARLLIGAASVIVAAAVAIVTITLGRSGDEVAFPSATSQPAMQTASTAATAATTIASGLDQPLWVGPAPGDAPGALWIAERSGKLVRRSGRELGQEQVWLDVSDRISTGTEQGLLGVAFAPDFATSRRAVLSLTDPQGMSRIELWTLGRKPGDARRISTLLTLRQPFPNHNGGHVVFGAHRTLYVGFGDGGGGGDPDNRAQDPASRFGKILAGEVRGDQVDRWRTAVTGARNPWRFWIDPMLGEMWIGDVGQDKVEEVDRVRLDPSTPPANLGWSVAEGIEPFKPEREVRGTPDLTWPVASYAHQQGRCSITGGFIYRGSKLPRLRGRYLFADVCTGELWSLQPGPGITADDLRLEQVNVGQAAHLGPDEDGEPLVASLDGKLLRLTPRAGSGGAG